MFHGHTELLWIGCLTGQFGPKNTHPLHWHQTPTRRHLDQREFHTVMSGIIFFFFVTISHLRSTCCTKDFSSMSCATVAKRIQEQKEGERVVSKSRPTMNVSSYLIATSSSAASSPIASKSLGMSGASERPDSRMSVEIAHSTQRRLLKCDSRMHTLAGWWKSSRETWRMRERTFQKKLMIRNLSFGVTSLFLKLTKLVGNHLQEKQQWWATYSVIQRTSKAGSSWCQCSTSLYGM